MSNKGDFRVSHKRFKNILNKELHLNENEREAKRTFLSAIDQFKQKSGNFFGWLAGAAVDGDNGLALLLLFSLLHSWNGPE